MPAIVRPIIDPPGYSTARCATHEENIYGTDAEARAWADQHNAEQHPSEETVTGL